ncbi:OmpA family protein [bacterium]
MQNDIACTILWGLVSVFSIFGQDDPSLTMDITDSLAVTDTLHAITASLDLSMIADSLKTIELSTDSIDSISVDSADVIQKAVSYSTDWSWLSMGEVCFADSILLYDPGAPGADTGDEPDKAFQNPLFCLGPPNHSDSTDGMTALGSGGTLILEFTNNVFFDNTGPDLYFWMPDKQPDEAQVWISQDGVIFQRVGTVSSESPFLDISNVAKPGDLYTILKIRDNPFQGDSNSPSLGSDIDAVAAIHTAVVEVIPLATLFYPMQTFLKPEASEKLNPVADLIRQYPQGQVLIEVYTENIGMQNYNLLLSQQWAKVIRDYFIQDAHIQNVRYTAIGLGNSKRFVDPHRRVPNADGVVVIIIFKG